MKIAFIGDIVGRPGREILKENLMIIKETEGIDFVVANGENASGGFGINRKNAMELLKNGVDCITGGNHTWDQKEISSMFDDLPLIRPLNYPDTVPGKGYLELTLNNESLIVINTMGHFAMPMVENPFTKTNMLVQKLHKEGKKDIIIDFHAESTAEKRCMNMMLRSKVAAIFGTHTHIGTDDLSIDAGTCYVSDVGMSGCRDNVIGMEAQAPIKRMTTGLPASLSVPKSCKRVLQMIICHVENGTCTYAKKIRILDDIGKLEQEAIYE